VERLAEIRNDTVRWLLTDGLGNVRAIADSTGKIIGREDFDAWGNRTMDSGRTSRFGYRGEWSDPATNFVFLRARWLDPTTGRFISTDPYEGDPNFPISLHRFIYGGSSPIEEIDPSGKTLFSVLFNKVKPLLDVAYQSYRAFGTLSHDLILSDIRNKGYGDRVEGPWALIRRPDGGVLYADVILDNQYLWEIKPIGQDALAWAEAMMYVRVTLNPNNPYKDRRPPLALGTEDFYGRVAVNNFVSIIYQSTLPGVITYEPIPTGLGVAAIVGAFSVPYIVSGINIVISEMAALGPAAAF
jgi:RHS repeat-associated protein